MANKLKKVLIVAGEESGDLRAAPLVKAVKAALPGTDFFGIAGDHCRQEGVRTFADIRDLAVIGFAEVVMNFSRIKKIFDQTLQQARAEKPDLAVLVDYPGFNLRLARELKKLNIKVVYYVSPQVWAWKASRVKIIKKVVDRMMVLFPFEKDFYARHNYQADFVGHPLMDEVQADTDSVTFRKSLGMNPDALTIGLVPGSRRNEIVRLLPVIYDAARILKKDNPQVQFLLMRAKSISAELLNSYQHLAPEHLTITKEYYNGLNACDFCIVTSGTANLETGIMNKPMVTLYKTAWLTSVIARMVVKIPLLTLVNIVAGKKVVTELIQEDATPENVANEIQNLISSPEKARAMRQELAAIKEKLGKPGATQRAARIVVEELSK